MIFGILLLTIIILLCLALSWIITCGIIYCITICFGLSFSWGIATGIWLILLLIGKGIHITIGNKKE